MHPFCLSLLHNGTGNVHLIVFAQRATHLATIGLGKGKAHTTRYNESIHFVEQVVDNINLRRDLRTSHDGHKRTMDVAQNSLYGIYFLLHQEAKHFAIGREAIGDKSRRSVRTMSGTKGIIHVAIGKGGKSLGELSLTRFEGFLSLFLFLGCGIFGKASGLTLLFFVEAKIF